MSAVASTMSAGSGSLIRRGRLGSRGSAASKLNLVSLMDIFTILVFFLMLNTGDVEVLQPDEKVELPKSFAKLRPDASPVIKINGDTVYFKEEAIVSFSQLSKSEELVKPLFEKLEAHYLAAQAGLKGQSALPDSISIMGDASLPYSQLKKVLYTCAQAGFRDIALAVEHSTSKSKKSTSNNQSAGSTQA